MRARTLAALFLAALTVSTSAARAADPAPANPAAPWVTIHNDFYWTDTQGNRILTRSGCIVNFNNTWYWYGGNPRGFREQYCYSSTDFLHWTNHGVVFTQPFDANRIDVVYNKPTNKYVMLLKYNGNGAHFGVATADKPEGPFTFKSQTLVDNALMGDSSIFVDDDGKAYLCYVSWAVGTNAQHGIYRLSDDYTQLDKRIQLWDIRSREAPHIFKKDGLYYYGTSRTAGIQSSGTAYYTAKDLAGPWSPAKPLPTPGSTNSWDSQVDSIVPFPAGAQAPSLYMFFGDRWTKDLPKGRNGDYIFLPMEFQDADPLLNYYQDWDLNPVEGKWRKFDPARNLAAGKPAIASSAVPDHAAASVTAPKTFENYINTFWQSDAAPDAQSITIDLEKPTDINRVILKWGTIAAKNFKIETSTDNTAWKEAFTTDKGSSYTVTDESFPTTSARYVRMTATTRAPAPFAGGRGGRAGRGARGGTAATQATTQSAFTPPPAPAPAGYTLFDFEVLKD
jgi:hypothetical protein